MKSCFKINSSHWIKKIVYFAAEKASTEGECSGFETEIKRVSDVKLNVSLTSEEAKDKVNRLKGELDSIVAKYGGDETVKKIANEAKQKLDENLSRFEKEKKLNDTVMEITKSFLASELVRDFSSGSSDKKSCHSLSTYEDQIKNYVSQISQLKTDMNALSSVAEKSTVNLFNTFVNVFETYKVKFEKWKKDNEAEIIKESQKEEEIKWMNVFKGEFDKLNSNLSNLTLNKNGITEYDVKSFKDIDYLDKFLELNANLDTWNPSTPEFINEKAKIKLQIENIVSGLKKAFKDSICAGQEEKTNFDHYIQVKRQYLAADGALRAGNISPERKVALETMKNLAEKRLNELKQKMNFEMEDVNEKEKNLNSIS